jgi:chromosome segregation ATPase
MCDKPQVQRVQTIQPTLHSDRIAFTPAQFTRIQQINEQIKTLTQRLETNEMDAETNFMILDQEINELREQLNQARQEVQAKQIELDNHWESGTETFQDISEVRSEIEEMTRRREAVEKRLEEINQRKVDYEDKLEESRKRFGIKSIEQGECRIDQIDTQIQRETMTNSEMRRLLKEQERIRAGMKFLSGIITREGDQRSMMEEERNFRKELRELSAVLRDRREEREVIRVECQEISGITKTLRGQLKDLQKRVTELERRLDDKYEQRRCLRSGTRITKRVAWTIQQEIDNLESEKMKISSEAEIATLKVMNEYRRQKAARTLIEYLSQLETKYGKQEQSKDADAMRLIAILRQKSKKGRHLAKVEEIVHPGQLNHALDKLKMFEVVEIVPPKTVQEIPEATELLQQKLREWTEVGEQSEPTMEITEMQPLIIQASQ